MSDSWNRYSEKFKNEEKKRWEQRDKELANYVRTHPQYRNYLRYEGYYIAQQFIYCRYYTIDNLDEELSHSFPYHNTNHNTNHYTNHNTNHNRNDEDNSNNNYKKLRMTDLYRKESLNELPIYEESLEDSYSLDDSYSVDDS